MSHQEHPRPTETSADDGRCAVCRTPLRPAQRYCTACGERRTGARLPFLDALGSPPTEPAAPPPAPPEPPSPGRAPRTWPVGPVAVVLGALAIGLVAGRWAADGDPAPAPAQEVRVVGGALAGAASGTTGTAAAATPTTASAATRAKAKRAAKAARAKGVPKKLSKQAIDDVLGDSSGNENLAPKDSDPNGANFDEIK